MATKGKVFLLESPNALDLLEERGERSSLEQVCRLFEHDATSFFLRDSAELKQTLKYIGAIARHPNSDKSPLFIHISTHGDSDSILIGSSDVSWEELADMISETYDDLNEYEGAVIFIISACHANEQTLTKFIKKRYMKSEIDHPPEYIFVFSDKLVYWKDSVVTWTIFYRNIIHLDFLSDEGKSEIQAFLRTLSKSNFGRSDIFSVGRR